MPAGYGRILLKLSGEALAGPGEPVDAEACVPLARQIGQLQRTGVAIAIVVGGGNLYRARKGFFSQETGDRMGMLATVMNGLALAELLERQDVPCSLLGAFPAGIGVEVAGGRRAMEQLAAGRVVIFCGGTGQPYLTTDTAAALRALEIGADVLFKASSIDGIYAEDPRIGPQSRRFRKISFDEALSRRLAVMDGTAFCLCRDNGLPIVVFPMRQPDALLRAARGEEVGTLVAANLATE
ncbi:MAG: uridine monophosphate kinase [Puniceicoccales bacterium]|jgi:uridylate kinase|nr:uridine monophosphate kinase [Puniceicoccales bacterium]